LGKFDNFFRVLAAPQRVLSIILITRSAKFENKEVIALQSYGIVMLAPPVPLFGVFTALIYGTISKIGREL